MKALWFAVCVVLVGIIGILDYFTGYEINLGALYLVPILIAAMQMGQKSAIAISFLCVTVWEIVEFPGEYRQGWLLYWNAATRLFIFIIISLTIIKLRSALDSEREQNKKVQELSRQKDTLLGIAVHDLRNPIGVIKMYASYLRNSKLEEPQKTVVDAIDSSSSFMLDLVNDVLDYSKLECGTVNLARQKQDYLSLLRQVVKLNSLLSEKKGISIHLMQARLPRINIDSVRMTQVLNNIISNAVSYSRPGTEIRISLRRQGSFAVTQIKDQGVGIAAKDLEHVFKPFHKGSNRPTAGEKSTGLGLTIAKNIVEAHGGRIWVRSTEGKGTSVFFSLPMGN